MVGTSYVSYYSVHANTLVIGHRSTVYNAGTLENIDCFHSDVIKLLSQNSEVLRILIYTRLKINKK